MESDDIQRGSRLTLEKLRKYEKMEGVRTTRADTSPSPPPLPQTTTPSSRLPSSSQSVPRTVCPASSRVWRRVAHGASHDARSRPSQRTRVVQDIARGL